MPSESNPRETDASPQAVFDAAGERGDAERAQFDRTVRSFRTKRGRCLVDGTFLRIEESWWGYYRNLYEDYWPAGWFGKFVVLGTVVPFLYAAWFLFRVVRGDAPRAWILGFAGILGAFVLFSGYRRIVRGYTSARLVPLADVRRVRATRGSKGLTRPRLLVEYDADGARRRRYLMLASLYTPEGKERFEEAERILEAAGLTVERSD